MFLDNKNSDDHRMKWIMMTAGITGGAVSSIILHPLDLIKIRFSGKIYIYF